MLVSLSLRGWEERLCSHLSPWLSNDLFSSCPCVTSYVPRRATVTLDRSTLECPQFSWVAQFTFAPCGGTKIRTAAQEYRYGEHSSVPLGCGRCFREGARCSLSCWGERAASTTVALLAPSTYTSDSTGCFQKGLSFRGLFAHLHIYRCPVLPLVSAPATRGHKHTLYVWDLFFLCAPQPFGHGNFSVTLFPLLLPCLVLRVFITPNS